MKQFTLILALTLAASVVSAQVKKDSTVKAPYKADPDRLYSFMLRYDQMELLMRTSNVGFIPFLKQVKLPMDQLDATQSYYNAIGDSVNNQYRRQFKADSLKTTKHK